MKAKSNSLGGDSTSSMSSSANGTATAASDASQHSSPDKQLAAQPPSRSASVQSDKAPEKAAKSFQHIISPFSAAAEPNKDSGSTNHSSTSTGPASGTDQHHQGSDAGEDPAHDSASSTCDGSASAGHLSRRSSNSKAHVPAASVAAGSTAAAQDAAHAAASDTDRTLSLSLGFSDYMSGSNLAASTALAAISTSAHQHSDMSFVPSTQALNAAGFSSGSAQQAGSATPTDGSTPRLSSPSGLGLGLFSTPLGTESLGLGAGMFGLHGLSVQVGGGDNPMETMIAELQATAGLTAEQVRARLLHWVCKRRLVPVDHAAIQCQPFVTCVIPC